MPEEKPKLPPKKQLEFYARYSTLALQMIVIIGVGVFAGVKLDNWLNTRFPVFTVVLSVLSVILSIYQATHDLLKKK
jgi:F0F1-type ATP synthase assembly protein I